LNTQTASQTFYESSEKMMVFCWFDYRTIVLL
jgi:hypothetical protein